MNSQPSSSPFLSFAGLQRLPEFIRLLNNFFIGSTIYPKTSPVIINMFENLYDCLQGIVSSDLRLSLGFFGERFVVNGQRVRDLPNQKNWEEPLKNFLFEHDLESMTFERGVEKPELLKFIDLLKENKIPLHNPQELSTTHGVHHIFVQPIAMQESPTPVQRTVPGFKNPAPLSQLSIETQVRKLSAMTSREYFDLRKEFHIELFTRTIIEQEKKAVIDDLLKTWDLFYTTASREEKVGLNSDVIKVLTVLWQEGHEEKMAGPIFDGLFVRMIREKDDFVIRVFIKQLADVVSIKMNLNPSELICKTYAKLKEAALTSEVIKSQLESFFTFLGGNLSEENLSKIIEEYLLKIDREGCVDDLIDVLCRLGKPAIRALIESTLVDEQTLKQNGYFHAYRRRRFIGQALTAIVKNTTPQEMIKLLKEYLSRSQWYVVKNITELILDIDHGDVHTLLSLPLNHLDERVRTKTIFILGKIADTKAIALLNEAFLMNHGKLRLDILNVLGRIGNKSSLQMLLSVKDAALKYRIDQTIESIHSRIT